MIDSESLGLGMSINVCAVLLDVCDHARWALYCALARCPPPSCSGTGVDRETCRDGAIVQPSRWGAWRAGGADHPSVLCRSGHVDTQHSGYGLGLVVARFPRYCSRLRGTRPQTLAGPLAAFAGPRWHPPCCYRYSNFGTYSSRGLHVRRGERWAPSVLHIVLIRMCSHGFIMRCRPQPYIRSQGIVS